MDKNGYITNNNTNYIFTSNICALLLRGLIMEYILSFMINYTDLDHCIVDAELVCYAFSVQDCNAEQYCKELLERQKK